MIYEWGPGAQSGSTWGDLGSTWGDLGSNRGRPGAALGQPRADLGRPGVDLGRLRVDLGRPLTTITLTWGPSLEVPCTLHYLCSLIIGMSINVIA